MKTLPLAFRVAATQNQTGCGRLRVGRSGGKSKTMTHREMDGSFVSHGDPWDWSYKLARSNGARAT